MTTAQTHYAAAAKTDRGRKRANNEDSFGLSVEHGVYVVCDGIGGAAGGEVASSMAVEEMLGRLTSERGPMPSAARDAIAAANRAIYSRSRSQRGLGGMGTTLVALVTEENRAWVLNVGDSRCYRLHDSRLEQVTLDHSLVEEQVRLGQITPSEALVSPMRNVITRALGTYKEVAPDVFELEPARGDLFLLCSDGLTRELSDSEIELILASDLPLEELCARLVHDAIEAGGNDNITCVLVRVEG